MDDAAEGIPKAFKYDSRVILERYIKGREFTVGILEDCALPPIELRAHGAFFDYKAKYEDSETEFVVDPEMAGGQREEVQRAGLGAHRAIRCDGYSRVDMILEASGRAWVLEVNTIPGMTERSTLPRAAQAAGMEFPELCDRIVRRCIRRRAPERVAAAVE